MGSSALAIAHYILLIVKAEEMIIRRSRRGADNNAASVTALAAELKIDRSAALRRVRVAKASRHGAPASTGHVRRLNQIRHRPAWASEQAC